MCRIFCIFACSKTIAYETTTTSSSYHLRLGTAASRATPHDGQAGTGEALFPRPSTDGGQRPPPVGVVVPSLSTVVAGAAEARLHRWMPLSHTHDGGCHFSLHRRTRHASRTCRSIGTKENSCVYEKFFVRVREKIAPHKRSFPCAGLVAFIGRKVDNIVRESYEI